MNPRTTPKSNTSNTGMGKSGYNIYAPTNANIARGQSNARPGMNMGPGGRSISVASNADIAGSHSGMHSIGPAGARRINVASRADIARSHSEPAPSSQMGPPSPWPGATQHGSPSARSSQSMGFGMGQGRRGRETVPSAYTLSEQARRGAQSGSSQYKTNYEGCRATGVMLNNAGRPATVLATNSQGASRLQVATHIPWPFHYTEYFQAPEHSKDAVGGFQAKLCCCTDPWSHGDAWSSPKGPETRIPLRDKYGNLTEFVTLVQKMFQLAGKSVITIREYNELFKSLVHADIIREREEYHEWLKTVHVRRDKGAIPPDAVWYGAVNPRGWILTDETVGNIWAKLSRVNQTTPFGSSYGSRYHTGFGTH